MGGCGCDCVGEEGSVCGTALIAASKYVHVCVCRGRGEEGRGSVCDCVGVVVIVWVSVGVIAWVRKGVCGWYSLNCCCRVCMCVRGECGCGCDCMGVGVIVWVGVGVLHV